MKFTFEIEVDTEEFNNERNRYGWLNFKVVGDPNTESEGVCERAGEVVGTWRADDTP